MSENKKVTKREMFEIVKASFPVENEHYTEVIKFIDHEIELLDKKNTTKNKKVGEEQNEIKTKVLAILQDSENPMTCTEISKTMEFEFTPQKVSAMLKKLVDSKKVNRVTEKRTAFFEVKEVE